MNKLLITVLLISFSSTKGFSIHAINHDKEIRKFINITSGIWKGTLSNDSLVKSRIKIFDNEKISSELITTFIVISSESKVDSAEYILVIDMELVNGFSGSDTILFKRISHPLAICLDSLPGAYVPIEKFTARLEAFRARAGRNSKITYLGFSENNLYCSEGLEVKSFSLKSGRKIFLEYYKQNLIDYDPESFGENDLYLTNLGQIPDNNIIYLTNYYRIFAINIQE